MSIEQAEESALTDRRGGGPLANAEPPPPGFLRQAVRDTVSSRTARFGLAWLVVLALSAVFAPFLANTHPIALKTDSGWSSPLLHALHPTDVLLLIAFVESLVLLVLRQFTFLKGAGIVSLTLLVLAYPAYRFVRPPATEDYTRFRTLIAEGHVQTVWMTPIPYSPTDRLRDDPRARLLRPSRAHYLGTDTNGADVASNILHASRIALSIGFISTGLSVVIGVVIGGFMGYYAGIFDLLGMRLIEIFEAIPRLLLLITITAFVQERNIYLMMVVIGITGWTGYARYLRGEFFSLRKQDFVQAAIAAGLPERSVVFRHLLPNGLTPVLVSTTFSVASAIVLESTLTFLGLGLVDEASWGGMLNQARAGGSGFVWWIAMFPGLAIFLTVFSYNLVGEAIRDALDPKLQSRA